MPFDPQYLLSLPPRTTTQQFTRRDTLLYALGVGAGQESDPAELKFVYEGALEALPTMAVVLGYPGFWQKEPEYGIDWRRVLHAEQSVTFHSPLPVEGTIRGELTIDEIIDKGLETGALLYSSRRVFEAQEDRLLATVRQVSFLRGDGGQGGSAAVSPRPHILPTGDPDLRIELTVRPEQALLYRLSGDYNPLHADPDVAIQAGLERPILHGLCTYGMAGRVLLRQLCGNEPKYMKRLDCRFTAPVYPGEQLEMSIWREGDRQAFFRVNVVGRNVVALDNGYVEIGE